jgi:hypothetical protein
MIEDRAEIPAVDPGAARGAFDEMLRLVDRRAMGLSDVSAAQYQTGFRRIHGRSLFVLGSAFGGWLRFSALVMPIRANIAGPSPSMTTISARMASCHSVADCSDLGSFSM